MSATIEEKTVLCASCDIACQLHAEVQAGRLVRGLLRVPHGWWKPELRDAASLSGAWLHADAQICPHDDDHPDREQGFRTPRAYPRASARRSRALHPQALDG